MINRNLLKEALKIKYYFAAIIAFGVLLVLSAIFQAKALSFIVDAVFIKGFSLDNIWVWMSILLFFIFLRAALIWGNEALSKTFAAKIKHDLRMRIHDTMISAGPVKLRGEKAGEVVNLAIEGIEALDPYFSEYLPQLAVTAIAPVLILCFVFPQDLTSAIIMLVTAPLIPLFMILIGKWSLTMTERQWNSLSRLGGHFLDMVRGLPTLKLFGRSKTQSNVIYRMSEEFRSTTMSVLRVSFLSALALELLSTLSTAVIAVTLGLRLIYGHITFDRALFLLLLVPEYYQPLRQLGAKFHAGMGGNTAAKTIYSFFDTYSSPAPNLLTVLEPLSLNNKNIDITFCDVSYRYEDQRGNVLNNLSFSLSKGECLILTGESGCGKSTIISLLLGFIKPNKGIISLNGQNISTISPYVWRENIAFVSQHPYLFSGTIEDNIRIAKPSANDEDVLTAARLAGAHDFIISLPLAYKTGLSEGGRGLSGGQKQLIAIARAFLKDSPLLVMDEPTSNLDYEAEDKVSKAIEKLIEGRTVLLVTHSPHLMSKADKVLDVESAGKGGQNENNH
jgi:ATP-binding cassette, subfamily C, bacterial CydD